jgi:charged multivesicular body protein 4
MPISAFQRLFDFGSKKDDTKNVSSSDAIQRLSDVEEMLNKKQQHLESQIEQEKLTAIRYSKQGNKRGALMALKRKKKYEKTLLQLDGTLTTLETQREYLQNASTNMDVLHVMRQAASALKKTNQNLDADQVHDLMDDLAEQHGVGKIQFLDSIFFYLDIFGFLFSGRNCKCYFITDWNVRFV